MALSDPGAGEARRPRGWAFIDLAALGRNTWWRYALTLLLVVLVPIAFIAVSFAAIFLAAARHPASGNAVAALLSAAVVSEIAGGITLAWCVNRSHRRPWLSLISSDLTLDWRRLAIGAGAQAGLLLLFVGIARLMTGKPAVTGAGMGIPALLLIMALIPFQAASEEMLFRGYLTQALGRLLRSRAVIAAIVGIAFGALHGGIYGSLTIPYLAGLSVLYSIVSLRDERLELTIGAHTATNWFGIADAVAITSGQVHLGWDAFGAFAVNGALFYAITRFLVRRFCGETGT